MFVVAVRLTDGTLHCWTTATSFESAEYIAEELYKGFQGGAINSLRYEGITVFDAKDISSFCVARFIGNDLIEIDRT